MGVQWTEEQRQVIELGGRNILVSAAAGSGKTAVLVERIITMLTRKENPVDVDRLLIVTFTGTVTARMFSITIVTYLFLLEKTERMKNFPVIFLWFVSDYFSGI